MLAALQSVNVANFSIPRETVIVGVMGKRMADRIAPKATRGGRKAPYHHGDLREALIAATRRLVMERGAEDFTLADACRVAGVTTAAPYRHFRSKQEILEEIAARG